MTDPILSSAPTDPMSTFSGTPVQSPQSIPDVGIVPNSEPQTPIAPETVEPELPVKSIIKDRVSIKNDLPIDSSKIPYWDESQGLIENLEKLFDSRVITLFVASTSSLTEDEVAELYYHLKGIGSQEKLTLVIYGPGGSSIAAYRLVFLLRKFTKKLIVVIPEMAASAMTMLALGGDEIVMGPISALSPIDTSIANHPLAPLDPGKRPVSVEINQVKKYLELVKSKDYSSADDFRKSPYFALSEKVHPIFLGTVQRSLSLSKLIMKGIIHTHLNDETKITQIVDKLNDDYPTHSFPILKDDISSLGFNVSEMSLEQNDAAMDLISFYQALSIGGTNTQNGIKENWRRYSIIETTGFRSYYYYSWTERLVDKAWVMENKKGSYCRAAIVKNKKNYYEVRSLDRKQFRKWIKGKEIKVD